MIHILYYISYFIYKNSYNGKKFGCSDSATQLFSTLNKFNESVNYNKLSGKDNTGAKEVKIHVKVPLEDAIDDVNK